LRVTSPSAFALAIDPILADLLGHILNEDGDALRRSRKTPANRRNGAIDITRFVSVTDLELLVHTRFAGFRDVANDQLESRDDFVHAQAEEPRVGRYLSEVRREFDEASVRELEAKLVRGKRRDANRRRLEHGFESHAGIDFGPRQLISRAMPFLRHPRQ